MRRAEEEERGDVQGDGVDGVCELLANSNSNGACPKRVEAGGVGGVRGGHRTGAAPRAEVGTRKGVDADTPQDLLDSVVTWEPPNRMKCAAEGGEGGSCSGGGAAEHKLNVCLVAGGTEGGGSVVEVCGERADWDGGVARGEWRRAGLQARAKREWRGMVGWSQGRERRRGYGGQLWRSGT